MSDGRNQGGTAEERSAGAMLVSGWLVGSMLGICKSFITRSDWLRAQGLFSCVRMSCSVACRVLCRWPQ
ncbi:hypothetical protein FIBSPDRAFT_473637 [Athelia psychrophila]|uniref:Uncharacterized protein n=1 Tax=Athelia psychrophila TaxID=1759441 RepID=A0A167TZZ2_9AGAM|nr:hypothetical protein FIBSPDRAFT_473637 [Fibularhizoctonia sp. CBS 109695]